MWPEWHVVCRLGGGTFGDVFQIYKEKYGIRVDSALKVIQVSSEMDTVELPFINPDDTEDDDGSQGKPPDTLRREIQIMEALRGAPNIVSIEDFYFKQEGTTSSLFVRMELLTSLKEVLSGGNEQHTLSSIREIRKLGKDICTALMHCEKKGIIHRDIKPANLFVDEFGHYKVGDFGASKRMDTVHDAHTMTSIGTISYMSPEIFRGRAYNNTVDIYALGLVLYQLLNNGRLPFLSTEGSYTAQDIDSANYMRLHGTPLPGLEGKAVGGEPVDGRLDVVVRKACAVDPAERYQTAKDFYDALILTETEAKNEAEPDIKQQRTPLPQRPLKSEEILTETKTKSGVESGKEQQRTHSSQSSHKSKGKEVGQSYRKKRWIGFVPLFIFIVVVMAVVLGRKGISSGVDSDNASQTEEKKGGNLSKITTSEDESSDVVEIPDPVLKKAIQDALEIGDREVTKTDALSLTFLSIGNSNNNQIIKDITGLSAFKNLTTLYLGGNQIRDISDLSDLKKLEVLSLFSNQISDISALSDLTNLTDLNLSHNQIRDISALAGLKNLTHLDLWHNEISDISALSDLMNLEYLRSMENRINDISALSDLTNLTYLGLFGNQISDVSALSRLTNLTELNLDKNQISDISPLTGLNNLTDLSLQLNQISDIPPLDGLTNLKYLDLSFNQISDISALSSLTNLTGLSMWGAEISDISVLSALKNLMNLDLNDNQISDINALSGLTNLTSLGLSYNQISDISALSGLTDLKILYLSNNQINDISALSGLTNLENLDLRFNPVVLNNSREEIMEVLSGAENLTNVLLF